MLNGLMMNDQLSVIDVLDFAAEVHPQTEVVSARVEGDRHRQTYRETWQRTCQLAHALKKLGVQPGDRVATLAWNTHRHLELYYAVAGIGAVCHTINPRLPMEQLTYIVDHADDSLIFFDTTFASLLAEAHAELPSGTRYVAMTSEAHMPDAGAALQPLCYETLLEGMPSQYDWPELDENTACAMCYTSGTTGVPKGVLYSQRSCLLEALLAIAAFNGQLQAGSRVMPVVPMFHVNAWGLPYCVPLVGGALVLPGPNLDGASLFALMDEEGVDASWGVPTIWMGLLAEIRKQGRKPKALQHIGSGGSAAPRSMVKTFENDYQVGFQEGWGMTETHPLGTQAYLTKQEQELPLERRIDIRSHGGRRLFGVKMKLLDEEGRRVPHDGESVGQLHVRGPIIAGAYYRNEQATAKAFTEDGWFATGDVARLTEDGVMTIVDRTKDLVKSGGEWISSIDLENAAAAHPGVQECAVIGLPHPKWGERPLLVVVADAANKPDKDGLLAHLGEQFAKWQLPDDILFVDGLPHTGTGKVSKRHLRDAYPDHYLDAQ